MCDARAQQCASGPIARRADSARWPLRPIASVPEPAGRGVAQTNPPGVFRCKRPTGLPPSYGKYILRAKCGVAHARASPEARPSRPFEPTGSCCEDLETKPPRSAARAWNDPDNLNEKQLSLATRQVLERCWASVHTLARRAVRPRLSCGTRRCVRP